MNRILDYLPAGWNVPLLLSRLREMSMFNDTRTVPDNYLLHLVASSKVLSLLPGSVVMHEGEFGRELYLVLEGRFEIASQDQTGQSLPTAIIRRGEFMGEFGMLMGQRREATARAQTAAVVLQVPEQVMQRMMEVVPPIHNFFEQINNARSLETLLRRMALFQGVAEKDMKWLSSQTRIHHYDRNEQLFSEDADGQPAREMIHILLEGFVKVARRSSQGADRILAYRQDGDYFIGGLDLLGDGRAVTVTAINRVRVAEVPQQTMQTLLMRYPEVDQRFKTRLQEYRQSALAAKTQTLIMSPEAIRAMLQPGQPSLQSSQADAAARQGLRALVDDGVMEGTEVLIIDLDKCVHCSECEDACARRHGHSRMNRKGMVVGNISITTACRQCQDPVCMLCSRAGIARMPSGEVYITESCIGCGICAERCPYDNITIVSLEEKSVGRTGATSATDGVWQQFTDFFKKGTGKERGKRTLPMAGSTALNDKYAAPGPLDTQQPYDAFGEIRKKLAIKCDLCAGYDNQACVQACPVGAAVRVKPTAFFGSTEDILHKQAK